MPVDTQMTIRPVRVVGAGRWIEECNAPSDVRHTNAAGTAGESQRYAYAAPGTASRTSSA
jgi:hypothetical protein